MEASFAKLVNAVLDAAYRRVLQSSNLENLESVHPLLHELSRMSEQQYAGAELQRMVEFAVSRAQAFAYGKAGNYPMVMKCIAPAIASCPKLDDAFVGGLSDALVQLTEAYSALGR